MMSKKIVMMLCVASFLVFGFSNSNMASFYMPKNMSLKFLKVHDSLNNDSIMKDSIVLVDSLAASKKIFKGTASYYHDKFVGRRTAKGDVFSQDKLTAAHRSLPLGSRVKVTNMTNGKSVVVEINDRMGKSRHAIDLTKAAAKELGFVQNGWAKVQIELL